MSERICIIVWEIRTDCAGGGYISSMYAEHNSWLLQFRLLVHLCILLMAKAHYVLGG